jgi:hypothetical protein
VGLRIYNAVGAVLRASSDRPRSFPAKSPMGDDRAQLGIGPQFPAVPDRTHPARARARMVRALRYLDHTATGAFCRAGDLRIPVSASRGEILSFHRFHLSDCKTDAAPLPSIAVAPTFKLRRELHERYNSERYLPPI